MLIRWPKPYLTNYTRKHRKAAYPAPRTPTPESITVYEGLPGINWLRQHVIDVWMPCLTAVYIKPTGDETKIGWLYAADNCWLDALTSTAAPLIIEFATQLVAAGLSSNLPTAAARHIMRSYLTFPIGSAEFDETV